MQRNSDRSTVTTKRAHTDTERALRERERGVREGMNFAPRDTTAKNTAHTHNTHKKDALRWREFEIAAAADNENTRGMGEEGGERGYATKKSGRR